MILFSKTDGLSTGDGKANEELGLGIDWPYNPDDPNPITNQRYVTPPALNLFNFKFFPYGSAIAAYGKFNRQNYNFNLAYSSQITKEHNIKVGGGFQYYDIANFSLGNEAILKLPSKIAANPDIAVETLIRREDLNNYGYNPLGEKTNDGLPDYEQSRKPSFLGIYVQDRIWYNDLIINVGLRYDRIDIANYIPVIPSDLKTLGIELH